MPRERKAGKDTKGGGTVAFGTYTCGYGRAPYIQDLFMLTIVSWFNYYGVVGAGMGGMLAHFVVDTPSRYSYNILLMRGVLRGLNSILCAINDQ